MLASIRRAILGFVTKIHLRQSQRLWLVLQQRFRTRKLRRLLYFRTLSGSVQTTLVDPVDDGFKVKLVLVVSFAVSVAPIDGDAIELIVAIRDQQDGVFICHHAELGQHRRVHERFVNLDERLVAAGPDPRCLLARGGADTAGNRNKKKYKDQFKPQRLGRLTSRLQENNSTGISAAASGYLRRFPYHSIDPSDLPYCWTIYHTVPVPPQG